MAGPSTFSGPLPLASSTASPNTKPPALRADAFGVEAMLIICWAAKGGSGATVTAVALSIALRGAARPTLLIDLAGDAPSALGIAEPTGPGITDWVVAPSAPGVAALDSLAGYPCHGLALIHRGHAHPAPDDGRWAQLAGELSAGAATTVVDAGTGVPPRALIDGARHAWLVLRPCYLGLRSALAQATAVRPTGLVVVREPGRGLTAADLAAALATPVVAEIAFDTAVARAIDAGLAMTRLPRGVLSELRRAA